MTVHVPRLILIAAAVLGMTAGIAIPSTATGTVAPAQRTSLLNVEDALMCTVCHEPLALAQSPEAQRERQLVEQLIARGDTKSQIIRVMLANYGVAVLAKPPAHGFNLTVYILPPAIVLAGALFLIFALPRWRRRAREAAKREAQAAPLSARDSARLEQDLARFD
jgi:cytochrome c-type biogenesis protein CcmH